MAQNHQPGNQQGFTLLEVSLALAIGIMIVISVAYTFGAVKKQQRFDNAMMMVQTIRTSMAAEKAITGKDPVAGPNGAASLADNKMTSGEKYYSANMGATMGDCNNDGAILDADDESGLPCDPYKHKSHLVQGAAPDGTGGWFYADGTAPYEANQFYINLIDTDYGTGGSVEVLPANPSAW